MPKINSIYEGCKGNFKNSGVIAWMMKTKTLCVLSVFLYRQILKYAAEAEMIIYDKGTDTWQGVEYSGD